MFSRKPAEVPLQTDHISTQQIPPLAKLAIRNTILGAKGKGGNIRLAYDAESYRPALTVAEPTPFTVATFDGSPLGLSLERTQQVLELAAAIGASGVVHTFRQDKEAGVAEEVVAHVKAINNPGILFYMPAANAHLNRTGGGHAKAFSMQHQRIKRPTDVVASFVGVQNDGHESTVYPAVTELVQNRLFVTSVTLASGDKLKNPQAYLPFQESIANGLGNMVGSIDQGLTYKAYRKFITNYNETHGIFGNVTNGMYLVAPNIVFNKDAYEQVEAGQLPELPLRVMPLRA